MSGESRKHAELVLALAREVERDHGHRDDLVVFADHEKFGTERPGKIGRFTPDLYASDIDETFLIVGEAKTMPDLLTERSRRQFACFLDHLARHSCSTLIVAVPTLALGSANAVLRAVTAPGHSGVVIRVISHD